jgi:ABC-type multidrug transport system fused ATPase/permease subunit
VLKTTRSESGHAARGAAKSAANSESGFRSLRRGTRFARPYRAALAAIVLLGLTDAALQVAGPILAGMTVNALILGHDAGRIVALALLSAIPPTVAAGLGFVRRVLASRVGEGLTRDLRLAVYAHLQRLHLSFLAERSTGDLVSRISGDASSAQQVYSKTLSTFVANFAQVALSLVAMVMLSWQVGLLVALIVPIYLLPTRRIGARIQGLQRESVVTQAALSAHATERLAVQGATLVKLYGRPEEEAGVFRALAEAAKSASIRNAVVTQRYLSWLTVIPVSAQTLTYAVGGFLAAEGHLSAGTVVTLALLLNRMFFPLNLLAGTRAEVATSSIALERLFEVLDIEPRCAEPAHPEVLPDGPLNLEFRDASFAYESGAETLRGIGFDAPAGTVTGLVGASGAGKSTIASLVCRLIDPVSGSVHIGGVDVKNLSFRDLRAAVGFLSQETHLLHDSVAANLRFARPEASDDDLWDALRRVHLDDLVASLPDGLDTMVNEHGTRFSGGERQRIGLARLLLAKSRIVLLDEPTANLDAESEREIQAMLSEAFADCTVLTIAHRLHTVASADQILVIDGGEIAERGDHVQLLSLGGRYARLCAQDRLPEPPEPPEPSHELERVNAGV